jgi:oligopeptide transport system substrate-binding protein
VLGIVRTLDPKTAAPLANLGFCIRNAVGVNSGKMPLDKLGVRVVDPATIEIKVETPCPTLLAALAEPPFAPVPKRVLAKFGDAWIKSGNIVSNGPFKLVDWRANDHVRLAKNPYFHDAANVKIDEVIYQPIEDDNTAAKRFRTGDIDMFPRYAPSDAGWLGKAMPGSLHATPAAGVNYIGINQSVAKLKDVRVRRALALAIDRETIAAKIMKLGESPAYGIVPFVSPAYRAPRFDFASKPLAARQAEARKLLADAGYGPGKPLTIMLRQRAGVANKHVAIALQSMWASIGVKAEIMMSEVKSHYASVNAHDFEVGVVAFFWPTDPEYFLSDILHDSVTNIGLYNSAAFDAKMSEGRKLVDVTKRFASFAQAEEIALKDVAVIPLYFSVTRNLVSPRLHGFVDNPRDFHPTRFLSLDPKGR